MKRLKILRINLTKEVTDLHIENYKTSLKEIKEYLTIKKDILCSWYGRWSIIKMVTFPTMIYRFNVIPILLSIHRGHTDFKIHMEMQGTQKS